MRQVVSEWEYRRKLERRRRVASWAFAIGMCFMVAGMAFVLWVAISTAIIVFS